MTKYTPADFYIDETNADFGPVVRWNSSNNIPFSDMLTEFLVAGYINQDTVVNSINAKKVEDRKAIDGYIASRQSRGYTDEEIFEMQAAFGPGETVVDVFTGQEIVL